MKSGMMCSVPPDGGLFFSGVITQDLIDDAVLTDEDWQTLADFADPETPLHSKLLLLAKLVEKGG